MAQEVRVVLAKVAAPITAAHLKAQPNTPIDGTHGHQRSPGSHVKHAQVRLSRALSRHGGMGCTPQIKLELSSERPWAHLLAGKGCRLSLLSQLRILPVQGTDMLPLLRRLLLGGRGVRSCTRNAGSEAVMGSW